MSQNQKGISSPFFKPKRKPKCVLLNCLPAGPDPLVSVVPAAAAAASTDSPPMADAIERD